MRLREVSSRHIGSLRPRARRCLFGDRESAPYTWQDAGRSLRPDRRGRTPKGPRMSTLVAVAWCRRASLRRSSPRCRCPVACRVRLALQFAARCAAGAVVLELRGRRTGCRRSPRRRRVAASCLHPRSRVDESPRVSVASVGGWRRVTVFRSEPACRLRARRSPDRAQALCCAGAGPDPQRCRVSSVWTASRGWSSAGACGSTTRGGRRLCENQTPSHAATLSDCLAAVGAGRAVDVGVCREIGGPLGRVTSRESR